jgi:very-short-patch-repair endonuclease
VTAPARTLIDLAAEASLAELEQAMAEARVQRLISDDAVRRALDRAPARAGTAAMRALLAGETEPADTEGALQRRLLELMREAHLPEPLVNTYLLGLQVDFFWPAERLVIETDGHKFHGHRKAFDRDRKRDQILVAAGYRVIRVTWHQLRREPMAVIARIAMALQVAAA